MYRVAVGAYDGLLGMFAAPDVGPGDSLAVTAEAGVDDLSRRHQREYVGEQGANAAAIDMIGTRTVTALASGIFRSRRTGGNAGVVGITREILVKTGVAVSADIAAHKIGREYGCGAEQEKGGYPPPRSQPKHAPNIAHDDRVLRSSPRVRPY